MTLIIGWIGVDQQRQGKQMSSMYFASDSRYSWGTTINYDHGLKVFGSVAFPEIFGFCGDVLFPSTVLSQLIPQIDSGIFFSLQDTAETKNLKILRYIESSLHAYPRQVVGTSFNLFHGTRVGKYFYCFKLTYSSVDGLKNVQINLPNTSTKIFSAGSGSQEFNNHWALWENQNHNNYRTSRAVFHCLSKTLAEIKDPLTGGIPQIIGLYRIKGACIFGTVYDSKKYILGKQILTEINSELIEWRNENFERMDPSSLKILDDAQRQPS